MPYPGLPAVRSGSAEGYFDDVVARKPDLPVWAGELYVETHRGTYTTQSALKKANRQAELMLRDAEIWGALAASAGRAFDREAINKSWKLVLLSQFHDILPGSSISSVYVDANRDHVAVRELVAPLIDGALETLAPRAADGVRVFNSLSWARTDAMSLRIPHGDGPVTFVDSKGGKHIGQMIGSGGEFDTVLVEGAEIPSIGYADLNFVRETSSEESSVSVSTSSIETSLFRIKINPDGAIAGLYDKPNDREVIAAGGVGNDLQLLQDGPEREDAWNVHDTIDKRRYAFEGNAMIEVIENGPVRGVVRVTRRHRDSTYRAGHRGHAGSQPYRFRDAGGLAGAANAA